MSRGINRRGFLMAVGLGLRYRSAAAQTTFSQITIFRQMHNDRCITGYVAVDGRHIAYTLELAWRGNTPLISAIPAGRYNTRVRYDHPVERVRLELVGVPGRTEVQIHIGNTPADIQGCILVGQSVAPEACRVNNSRAAYRDFRAALWGNAEGPFPNLSTVVEIRDA